MRIRGTEAELEEAGLETDGLVKSTSKLQDLVKGMTGFDILKDDNTFKDIYDIVVGIGEKWKELSDIDQSALLEALSGKHHGNALAATLNNIDLVKETYQTSLNSDGSAMKEQEAYAQSIQYSLDKLKATFQELSTTVVNADIFKGLVDGAQGLLDILTQIAGLGNGAGLIGILGGAAGITAFVKNLDQTQSCLQFYCLLEVGLLS